LHIRGHRPRPLAPSVGVAFGWVMRRGTGRVITLLFWCSVGFRFFGPVIATVATILVSPDIRQGARSVAAWAD